MQEKQHTSTAEPTDRYWGQVKDRLEATVAKLRELMIISALVAIAGGAIARFARGANATTPPALSFNAPTSAPALSAVPKVFKPQQTGRFRITFSERSPYSSVEEMSNRGQFKLGRPADHASPEFLAQERHFRASLSYDIAAESFEVYVPPAYKPSAPFGLFVWISAGAAELPPGWGEVLARHRLIWISANNTGNGRPAFTRAGLALDAVHNMKRLYNLDEARIYLSGFSGGASCAAYTFTGYAGDVFRGCMPICGASFIDGRLNEQKKWEAGAGYMQIDGDVEWVKKNVKICQVEGQGDPQHYAGAERASADAMLLEGFERFTAIEVPRLGHSIPGGLWFDNAVKALESKPKTPPTTAPTTDPHPLPGQVAQARRFLVSGEIFLSGKYPIKRLARKELLRVINDFPTTPSAAKARQLLEQLNHPASTTTTTRSASH
jgi:hypothetical protein